jgi:dTDP-glucose pyrophosphorylase
MVTNLISHLPGYPGEVWYNPAGIANVISLADAEKYFHVRYDSKQEKAFVVEKPDGTEHHFAKTDHGLYCFDTATHDIMEHGTTFVTTVAS